MKKQTVEPKKAASKRKPSKAKKLACVDFFCGCGGLTLGVREAAFALVRGFRSVFA